MELHLSLRSNLILLIVHWNTGLSIGFNYCSFYYVHMVLTFAKSKIVVGQDSGRMEQHVNINCLLVHIIYFILLGKTLRRSTYYLHTSPGPS